MSMYADFGSGAPTEVSSNQGWSQFGDWVGGLDVDDFGEVVHLWEYGWSQEIETLTQQLTSAIAEQSPDDDVVSVAQGLLELLAGEDVVVITDGFGPSGDHPEKQRKDFDPNQPRGQPGNPGQFGPGSGVPDTKPKPSEAGSASGIISRLGSSTWDGLKKAGVNAKHVEHVAAEWASSHAEANVAKLPEKMQTAVKGTWLALRIGGKTTFATYRAGQAAAEAVAKRRGASPEQAARLRTVLSTIDIATFKPVSIGVSMAAGPAVGGAASFIPLGSATYLAYSTVRDPMAVYRTIADQVKKIARKLGFGKSASTNDQLLNQLCDYLNTDEDMATFLAAMDEAQDVGKALKVAKKSVSYGPRSALPKFSTNGVHK